MILKLLGKSYSKRLEKQLTHPHQHPKQLHTEMIGPVAKPYASAIPLTKNITRYTGKKVFALAAVKDFVLHAG